MSNLLKRLSLFGLFQYYWYIIQWKGYDLDSAIAFYYNVVFFWWIKEKIGAGMRL